MAKRKKKKEHWDKGKKEEKEKTIEQIRRREFTFADVRLRS